MMSSPADTRTELYKEGRKLRTPRFPAEGDTYRMTVIIPLRIIVDLSYGESCQKHLMSEILMALQIAELKSALITPVPRLLRQFACHEENGDREECFRGKSRSH